MGDGDGRIGSQGFDHLLVKLGEFKVIGLLGEVDQAKELLSQQDGHAEEGVHLRVVGGETTAAWIGRDIRNADAFALPFQGAQHPFADRLVAGQADFLRAHPDRDELDQLPALIDDSQCSVLGAGLFAGYVDNPLEDLFEGKVPDQLKAGLV
jgi:hypothetical protein